jgi:CBS domain containing-hemolysin-like protein
MDVWIGYAAAAVGSATLISREAMSEVSLSDIEEILRKEGRTQQVLPRIEAFAERFRDLAFSLRCIDFFLRAVVAVVMHEQLVGHDPTVTANLSWLGALLAYLFVQDIVFRQLATAYAERLTLWLMPSWILIDWALYIPLRPLVFARELFDRQFRGNDDEDQTEDAEDEIMAALSLGSATGQIDEEQREMVESVFDLGNSTVDRLMTPRTDMIAIDADSDVASALEIAQSSGHSRLPVFVETRDNIVGILYVKDILGNEKEEKVDSLMRQPVLVPETKNAFELLQEFRRDRIHLAVVLDEYGGTAGLISIEDIIEEVFGDIADEYDQDEEEEILDHNDTMMEVDARMHVDEINEAFDAALPESDRYESIGGLLTAELGRIPNQGEIVEHASLKITVLEATDRRAVKVRLEKQS